MNYEKIIYLLSNALRVYTYYHFVSAFFKQHRRDWGKELIAFGSFFAINSTLFLLINSPILNVVSNVLCLFATMFLYSRKVNHNIAATLLMYILDMLCDSLLFIFADKSVVFSSGLAASLLFFLIALLAEYTLHNSTPQKLRLPHLFSIITIPFGSIAVAAITMVDYRRATVIEAAILLLINVMVFYLYASLNRAYSDRNKSQLLEQQTDAYKNQLKVVYRSQEKIRYLKHDMKNHLHAMEKLVNEEDYNGLKAYIHTSEEYMSEDNLYVNSGNAEVDSLLNYKLIEADKLGTEIYVSIFLPSDIVVNAFDLNIILGNLLDNAIEALENSVQRKLWVDMKYEKSILYFQIKNSYSEPPDRAHDVFRTTKKSDSELHGIGLQSVRHTLDAYHGTLEATFDDEFFTVNAMMYVK